MPRTRSTPALAAINGGALVMLAVGLFGLYLGSRVLVADLMAYQADIFVKDWSSRKIQPADAAWNVALEAAVSASSLFPSQDGANTERIGRIHEWRHYRLPIGHPDAQQSRLAAAEAYREAIAMRPLWPYTWSRLAAIKMKLGEFNEEFDLALRRALELGPWRPGINSQVTETGLVSWQMLSAEQRELVVGAAERVARQRPARAHQLVSYAEKLHLAAFLCDAFDSASAGQIRACDNGVERK